MCRCTRYCPPHPPIASRWAPPSPPATTRAERCPDLSGTDYAATMTLSRSTFLKLAAAVVAAPAAAQTGPRMQTRKIPSTGEQLPVVGCGTWRTFDVGASPAERAPLAEVLRALFEAGGSVIDSSPMYGRAEGVVGDLLAAAGTRDKAFLATNGWISGREAGIAQMNESFRLLRTNRIDLMQIHKLLDSQTHLPTLRACQTAAPI